MLYNSGVYLNYLVNQETIAALFCVNKAEPEIQCNGSCHLKNQLTQSSSENEQNVPPEFRFEVLNAVTSLSEGDSYGWTGCDKREMFVDYRSILSDGYLQFDTPPPQCA